MYLTISVADPGCLSRIHIFPSRIQGQKGFRIRIKEFKYFNPKNCSQALGNMIRMVIPDPDPRSWFFTHHGSRIQGSKRHQIPDPQHCSQSKISAYSKLRAKGISGKRNQRQLCSLRRVDFAETLYLHVVPYRLPNYWSREALTSPFPPNLNLNLKC